MDPVPSIGVDDQLPRGAQPGEAGGDAAHDDKGLAPTQADVEVEILDFSDVNTPSIDSDSQDGRSLSNDTDSAIGSFRNENSTMSLRSSIYEHVEENGRTYHKYKNGKYLFPNDELEQNRLDLQHALFLLTFHDRLYLAPLKDPQRVLDYGTGTGIWAIDFAIKHPSADVLGTDLSPIQPDFVPPNCRFEVDDIEDEWTFNHKFDYVHGRAMGTCFTDPAAVFAKAYEGLIPGGYLETQDIIMPMKYVGEIPVNSALYKWNTLVVDAANLSKRPWTLVKDYAQYMRDEKFEDIVEKKFYWPTNPWPKGKYFKTLALYFQQDLLDGLEGISMKLFTNLLGWSTEEVQVFLVAVRNDLKDPSIHAYVTISVAYGRKPCVTT